MAKNTHALPASAPQVRQGFTFATLFLWSVPLLIAGLEGIRLIGMGGLGAAGYFVLLLALAITSAMHFYTFQRRSLSAVALLVAIRCATLGIPGLGDSPVLWLGGALVAAAAACIGATPLLAVLSEPDFNSEVLATQLGAAASGLLLGALSYGVQLVQPQLGAANWQNVPTLLLFAVAAVESVLIFGIMQRHVQQQLGHRVVPFVALLVTALSVASQTPVQLVLLFGGTLFWAWLVRQRRLVAGVALAHGSALLVEFHVLPALAIQQSTNINVVTILIGFAGIAGVTLATILLTTPRVAANPNAALASNLRQMRKQAALTYSGLGQLAGLSAATVAEIEMGLHPPSSAVVQQLARSLEALNRIGPPQRRDVLQ